MQPPSLLNLIIFVAYSHVSLAFTYFGKNTNYEIATFGKVQRGRVSHDVIKDNLFSYIIYEAWNYNYTTQSLHYGSDEDMNYLKDLKQRTNVSIIASLGSRDMRLFDQFQEKRQMERLANETGDAVKRFGFDGINLVWVYPYHTQNALYHSLLESFRNSLQNLTLCVEVDPFDINTGGYDRKSLHDYVDYVIVITMDLYRPFPGETPKPGSALRGLPWTISSVTKEWEEFKTKLIVTIPLRSMLWQLRHGNQVFTNVTPNYVEMPYREIRNKGWTKEWNNNWKVPYVNTSNGEWLSYENGESIKAKIDFICDREFGGFVLDSLTDDYHYELAETSNRLAFELCGQIKNLPSEED